MNTYDFLEHVFDATQLASEKVLGTPAIAVVRADKESNEILTSVFDSADNKAGNYRSAIEWCMPDNRAYYIIGGDIDAND